MKDWLGNEYGPGDQVIYAAMSGRSVTMVLAEVQSIYKVYRDEETYEWVHVSVDDPVPFKRKWNRETRQETLTTEPVDTELRVSLQPLKSSRWEQHYGKTRYIDTRSGKGIDHLVVDKKTGLYRHLTGGYFENKETGEKVHEYYYHDHPAFRHYLRWDPKTVPDGWVHVESALKPYVKKIKEGPGPVTISVTENIVKWHSDDVVDWA